MLMDAERGCRVDAYAKKGSQLSGALGPCFRCHSDHWVRYCPMEQLEKGVIREPYWPKVPCYCEGCGIDF